MPRPRSFEVAMSVRHVNLARYSNRFDGYTELRGVSARVFKDGVWGFASRAQLDNDAVLATIDEATRNAALLARHAARPEIVLPRTRTFRSSDFSTSRPRLSQQQSIEFLQTLDAHIAATYPDLKSRTVTRLDLDMEKHLYTADASEGYSNTTRSLLYVRLTATNDAGAPVEYGHVFGGRGQFEDVFADPAALYPEIAEIYRHLTNKRHGVRARAGMHDVVLDSSLAGVLAHEAIGHTTEADLVQEGSVAGDYLGKLVASPLVTLVDFAHTYLGETLPVPVYVDDEGVESTDTVLIENGILKSFMHNKESSVVFGVPPTGNARAYRFSDEPLIRMRNTAILAGNDKLDDMIASIDDGYYLLRYSNGQADSTSEFMFGVTLGYEISNGKLGRAITDTTISGVAFDMLKTITMVSDEMNWTCAGMCGKKTPIPVGMGGPSIKCRVHLGGD
jgi:TldD protein